jgi:hypothetical protein
VSLWLTPEVGVGSVYQSFAPYDEGELPGSALPSTWFSAYGVFFFPTLDVSPIFTIERFRFWHREQNATPDPYRIHLVVRSTASQTIYVIDTIEDLMTTCSNCWEEVEIERSFWDSSTPGWSYGIFIQPLGGGAVTAEPGLRVDFSVAEPLVNLWAYYDDLYGFSNLIYMEEYDGGDFFMEVIVRYDVTTATVATSMSAIKALY